jgi:hypothetical protein
VRRAIILSNGALGAEGQCLGLVRALGLGNPGRTLCPGLPFRLRPLSLCIFHFSLSQKQKLSRELLRVLPTAIRLPAPIEPLRCALSPTHGGYDRFGVESIELKGWLCSQAALPMARQFIY